MISRLDAKFLSQEGYSSSKPHKGPSDKVPMWHLQKFAEFVFPFLILLLFSPHRESQPAGIEIGWRRYC
jgi:hypothetical protein